MSASIISSPLCLNDYQVFGDGDDDDSGGGVAFSLLHGNNVIMYSLVRMLIKQIVLPYYNNGSTLLHYFNILFIYFVLVRLK